MDKCVISSYKDNVPYLVRLALIIIGIGIIMEIMGLLRQEGKLEIDKDRIKFNLQSSIGSSLNIRKDEIRNVSLKKYVLGYILILESTKKKYRIKFQKSWVKSKRENTTEEVVLYLKENYNANII